MKINRQLNTFTYGEYSHLLEHYQRFTDFNSLGLFRSITENEKLTPEQKIKVRDETVLAFPKFFEFLQLKDPFTYFSLVTLGQSLTSADSHQTWENIKHNQQRILASKRIKHRNFGTYSKHECGYETCHLRNLMIRQGSWLAEHNMHFQSDKGGSYAAWDKARIRKQNRKQQKQVIERDLEISSPQIPASYRSANTTSCEGAPRPATSSPSPRRRTW
ncbi:hypothetical protein [Hymenobacter polaris]|uniref:hypothetical protein n=1 Tax=Hymenobacter polaris TaxID=2682546 RepID=UPI0018A2737D|nr:hypothetical protein [Hymenobacter polaris]